MHDAISESSARASRLFIKSSKSFDKDRLAELFKLYISHTCYIRGYDSPIEQFLKCDIIEEEHVKLCTGIALDFLSIYPEILNFLLSEGALKHIEGGVHFYLLCMIFNTNFEGLSRILTEYANDSQNRHADTARQLLTKIISRLNSGIPFTLSHLLPSPSSPILSADAAKVVAEGLE